MSEKQQKIEMTKKVTELMREVSEAVLVATDQRGQAHARRMQVIACDDSHTEDLWFMTDRGWGKIDERRRKPRIAAMTADGSRYLVVRGHAQVVIETDEIEDKCLIQVRPQHADYWDRARPRAVWLAVEAANAWIHDDTGPNT